MAFAPFFNTRRFSLFAGDVTYSERAVDLLQESLAIDMLNPVGMMKGRMERWMQDPESFSDEDFEWMRRSGINVFHPASGDRGYGAWQRAIDKFGAWNSWIVNNPDRLARIDSAADLDAILASGRMGIVFGTQNSDHFRTADDVAAFHRLGQRVSQLTYNWQNHIGAGGLEKRDAGLTLFGHEVVAAMNRAGMTVDVSHCGDVTTLDAFEASIRPVAITHSNARALNPGYQRAKTDEAIRKMAATGGVMGVTTLRAFVRDRDPVTVEHVIDHIDHIARLTAIEHVGIGSDAGLEAYGKDGFADYEKMPAHIKDFYRFRETIDIVGLDHPQRMFDIVDALIRRGYSDDHIRLVIGGNFARMLAETWQPESGESDSTTTTM
jgi:membrane dipeptidase